MPKWADEACAEYRRRLPRDIAPVIRELPLAQKGRHAVPDMIKQEEGRRMMNIIPASSRVIALDIPGKRISSEELSEKMAQWQMEGQNVCILIGGPDGLSHQCLQRAEACWSLSGMTLPHPLVRVILMEQLYRAWTILCGHPYHK